MTGCPTKCRMSKYLVGSIDVDPEPATLLQVNLVTFNIGFRP